MHLKSVQILEANEVLLEEVNQIYLKCRENLFENGILQWDHQYPNKEYFLECIQNKCLFVLMEDSKMIGHVVLNEWQSDEWESIPWKGHIPLVIHSLMIHPEEQGKGIGTTFVQLCEKLAKEQGYKSVRLDAFSGNEKAIQLYKRLNYQERGRILFPSKPKGHQEYICFEKELE